MINWRKEMKRILVFVLIICMAFIIAGAQEKVEPNVVENKTEEEPTPKLVTRLKVTMIDGINDKVFELKNSIVQIRGELNICDNVFPYNKTFLLGNDYEITIMIKLKD